MLDSLEIIGISIVAGFAVSKLFTRIKIPAVAGYVLIGIILGPSCLNVFHYNMLQRVDVISDLALSFIAYIIGSELHLKRLKKMGRKILIIVLCEAFGAFLLVFAGIYLVFKDISLALILGAIASATAPAATVMVIKETKAKGTLTSTLLALVAIDDAIALIIYSFASSFAKSFLVPGTSIKISSIVFHSAMEIVLSVLLGLLTGIVISIILKYSKNKTQYYILVIGAILIVTGLSQQFGLSYLLSNMACGMLLTNLRPAANNCVFEQIDNMSPPIFIAFFVIAGAHLRLDLFIGLWFLSLVFLLLRIAGKIGGASLGATLSNAEDKIKKYVGFGLISQVGVAIGLSVIVTNEFAGISAEGRVLAETVVNVLLGTTIFTEMIGPVLTKRSLIKAGEIDVKEENNG